ncbi:Acetoacetate decarboxylase (ADC) [Algoriphagus faecimaris]|uniref:Acetoacetate decarboxylase (ADC) n=1 Tax=Algoriphagus faecimaris TaxID=686796 RepID=A0A1G6XZV9_9BACT|nr:acetoacetate decarboxylase family protein [Algoriphagus faecimaris]SDD83600.1 Acetoacetate decarboxylase (ADC) [Algoriphagus faecimaris]
MNEKNLINLSPRNFVKYAPAPWDLEGQGIILVYKFPKKWVEECTLIPDYKRNEFKRGLGFLMLVNYSKSPIGPYRELLLIPGKFGENKKQSITSIFVDSLASTQNGRNNWGIPKKTLKIDWIEKNGKHTITVKKEDEPVFSCEVKAGGVSFPVTTSFLPIDLQQRWNGIDFFVKPSGSGWGKLAQVKIDHLDPEYFPDIRSFKPLFAVKVDPFRIHFPEAKFHE